MNLAHVRQRWVGYCEGRPVDKDIRDAVVISVCSALYNYLLKRVSKVQQSILEPTTSTSQIPDDIDSVYYRFCGAAIANMLHARYNKRQACKQEQKEALEQEIRVLKCIQCTDKSHIGDLCIFLPRSFCHF